MTLSTHSNPLAGSAVATQIAMRAAEEEVKSKLQFASEREKSITSNKMVQMVAKFTKVQPKDIGALYTKVFMYPECQFVNMNHDPKEETLEIIFKCPGEVLSTLVGKALSDVQVRTPSPERGDIKKEKVDDPPPATARGRRDLLTKVLSEGKTEEITLFFINKDKQQLVKAVTDWSSFHGFEFETFDVAIILSLEPSEAAEVLLHTKFKPEDGKNNREALHTSAAKYMEKMPTIPEGTQKKEKEDPIPLSSERLNTLIKELESDNDYHKSEGVSSRLQALCTICTDYMLDEGCWKFALNLSTTYFDTMARDYVPHLGPNTKKYMTYILKTLKKQGRDVTLWWTDKESGKAKFNIEPPPMTPENVEKSMEHYQRATQRDMSKGAPKGGRAKSSTQRTTGSTLEYTDDPMWDWLVKPTFHSDWTSEQETLFADDSTKNKERLERLPPVMLDQVRISYRDSTTKSVKGDTKGMLAHFGKHLHTYTNHFFENRFTVAECRRREIIFNDRGPGSVTNLVCKYYNIDQHRRCNQGDTCPHIHVGFGTTTMDRPQGGSSRRTENTRDRSRRR